MLNDLEPAKQVLRSFLADIDDLKALRKNTFLPKEATSLASASFWEDEDAYIWLYAEAWKFLAFMHRPKPHSIPSYYLQPACLLYQQWRMETKELFHKKCDQIPQPDEQITLIKYLQRLSDEILEKNEHRDVWIESLRSFCQFLREDTLLEDKGPLEVLFPSKESCKGMELRKGYRLERNHHDKGYHKVEMHHILRSIEDTVYPIDIYAKAEIFMNLANVVLYGRSNVQHSAAVALGFAWLCHAVGCYGLVTRETLVFATEVDNFRPPIDNPDEWFKPTYFIGVSSLYGIIDVPVSKTLYEFLRALPRKLNQKGIFNIDLDVAARTFREKGVKPSKRTQNLGKITFLTCLSQPHYAVGFRTEPTLTFCKSKKRNCRPPSNLKK